MCGIEKDGEFCKECNSWWSFQLLVITRCPMEYIFSTLCSFLFIKKFIFSMETSCVALYNTQKLHYYFKMCFEIQYHMNLNSLIYKLYF